ncbi:MAG TPA: heme o synthase [Clostridia bacterium]|nr:heme o synthase [Clostridia bacterium]
MERNVQINPINIRQSLVNYLEVTKPASVALLVFTAWATMFVAAGGESLPLSFLIPALIAITLGCGGANTISCYIDLDLDTVMERTKKRPLPSGRIYPAEKALYWGIFQLLAAVVIAWQINYLSSLCILAGAFGYLFIYSIWLKRRSSWNIILGGFSGAMPALFGWAAVKGSLELLPFLIGAVVVLWIPNHIWSLAIFYSDDYHRVEVPMFSAVVDIKKALHCIAATVILMYIFSILIYIYGGFGIYYLSIALVTGAVSVAYSIYVYFKPSKKSAWVMFKISSPYLFLLFLAMIIDIKF